MSSYEVSPVPAGLPVAFSDYAQQLRVSTNLFSGQISQTGQ